jgi:hypothetical protein
VSVDEQRAVWIAALASAIRPLLPSTFYGAVEINVQAGGITTINVKQSFRPSEPR